jgi:serine/threonine-protein kinase
MTTRAQAVGHTFAQLRAKAPALPSSSRTEEEFESTAELAEAPFVTTLTVEERELHRVSFAPIYLHEARPSKRCEPFYMSVPPDITFTPDDSELHPLTVAINPIAITLPGLSGVSALKPAEVDPLLGHIVANKYKLLSRIGLGGAGIVYKAENLNTGETHAMKALTKDITARPHAINQLRQEARATDKLTNEHTVKVSDFGDDGQLVYLVMEYLEGKDLANVIRRDGPLTETRAIAVAQQICQSVAEAHRQGIVHRDIKPENVFLVKTADDSDFVKVLDFGVAHLHEANDARSEGRSLVYGTPNYMAPEQIRGELVDARTDVYALGALLYKAVSGVAPFVGETPKAVLDKHLHEVPTPLRTRVAGLQVSDGLEALIARALSKDPGARQQNMAEMHAELAALLSPARRAQATVSDGPVLPTREPKATKSKSKKKGKKKSGKKK